MKNRLILVALFLLCPCCSSQNEITCNSPRISDGSFQPQRTVYHDGDLIRIRCDSGFTFEPVNGEQVVQCTKNGWSPSPKCVRKGCDSVRIENGRMENYVTFPKREGEQVWFQCNDGFLPKSKERSWQRVTCTNFRFEPEPKCFKTCDPSQRFYYGRFLSGYLSKYIEGDNITLVCDRGYSPANQQSTITCTKTGWSPAPNCIQPVTEGRCGRPPPVENGDVVDTPKLTYLNTESVTYQCQNFYTMRGFPRVTCQNGRWSQTPTCRVACTASEEDMRERNIRLRWPRRDTLYVPDGDVVEFLCLRGYEPHPSSGPLRTNCVEGKFDYPNCIRYN